MTKRILTSYLTRGEDVHTSTPTEDQMSYEPEVMLATIRQAYLAIREVLDEVEGSPRRLRYSVDDERVTTVKDLVACPHCAEMIQKSAKVCRFCKRDIER